MISINKPAAISFLLLSVVTAAHGKSQRQRSLRGLQYEKCGVTGFALYDPTNGVITPLSNQFGHRIFLDEYKNGKINIIANVGSPCNSNKPIKCVKIAFGNNVRKERAAPYTLFGDNTTTGEIFLQKPSPLGLNSIQAWTYTDNDCTKDEDGYNTLPLHVVETSSVSVSLTKQPLVGLYHFNNPETKPSATESYSAAASTCAYIEGGYSGGLNYKTTISVSNFTCAYNVVESDESGVQAIEYNISATFTYSSDIGPYDGDRTIPDSSKVTDLVERLLSGTSTSGPNAPTLLHALSYALPVSSEYATDLNSITVQENLIEWN